MKRKLLPQEAGKFLGRGRKEILVGSSLTPDPKAEQGCPLLNMVTVLQWDSAQTWAEEL